MTSQPADAADTGEGGSGVYALPQKNADVVEENFDFLRCRVSPVLRQLAESYENRHRSVKHFNVCEASRIDFQCGSFVAEKCGKPLGHILVNCKDLLTRAKRLSCSLLWE